MKMIRNTSEFSKGHLQGSPEDDGLSKRAFLKALAFACLGVGPFVNACGIVNSEDTNPGAVKKSNGSAKNGSVPEAAKPSIDLAAPAKIETATFALG
jgi:hypothetical protein